MSNATQYLWYIDSEHPTSYLHELHLAARDYKPYIKKEELMSSAAHIDPTGSLRNDVWFTGTLLWSIQHLLCVQIRR
jgi:hypothetical protein